MNQDHQLNEEVYHHERVIMSVLVAGNPPRKSIGMLIQGQGATDSCTLYLLNDLNCNTTYDL